MSKLGRWLDKPRVEFEDDGRKIRLLEPLRFIDPGELCWVAPTNSVADGASIPQLFWSFIGGPLDDKYRNASIIHDFYCSTRTRPWEKVHTAFYDGMMASGVQRRKAKVMYVAVRYFGPHWTEMDSENIQVLLAQGFTDSKKVQRTLTKEIEDCTRPFPARAAGVPPSEDVPTTEDIEQSQFIYYFDHQDVERDIDWVVERFDNDDPVSLADIDAAIDDRVAQMTISNSKPAYYEMS